jgi:acyl-CoA thioester hydrolase
MSVTGFGIRTVVGPEDIDDLGHANNVSYLRWVLAAATAHWTHLRAEAPPEATQGVAWVVMRHQVEYVAPAFPGDELEVVTWVPTCTSMTCERFAEISRAGTVLARSASVYCAIDAANGRPRRITETIRGAIGGPPVVPRTRLESAVPPRPDRIVRRADGG